MAATYSVNKKGPATKKEPARAGAPLSEEVALRIGLAARELPECDLAGLVQVLIGLIREPLTAKRLARIRLNRLRQAVESASLFGKDGVDEASLRRAVACLKGQGVHYQAAPPPQVDLYRDGDMPDSIRVACASNSGEKIDGHFGGCPRYLIYQISPQDLRLVAVREVGKIDPDEDKNQHRAALIDDCALLYCISIGGPAAAKVVKAGVFPIKIPTGDPAQDELVRLQAVLESPPPWLAKAMGMDIDPRFYIDEGPDQESEPTPDHDNPAAQNQPQMEGNG